MGRIAVETRDLYKSFRLSGGRQFPVIRGVSMQIREGDYCAITGKSGSGKSTLLNLLAGFDKPDSGDITVFGENIGKDEEEFIEYRKRYIGFVFQAFHLVPELTVLENIAFPLMLQGIKRSLRERKAEELLEMLGLVKVRKHLPGQLSGGQKQRTAICRALITDPQIILADEPTGNLDSENSKEVMDLLERTVVVQGKTLIMVTHDEGDAARASRIIRVADGRIEEDK